MAWERGGVPGGASRTSWSDRDVPAMWHLLENQQSDDHWRLVAGWRKASELTATHLRRLEQYRTNLAEVWPPDRNAAAAAYVARLDFLIQNVRTTHDVAAANYSTLAATVGALAGARRDLKPLYDEYVATSRTIKDHADLAAFNAAAEAPTVIGAAPVGARDLERLNNRARAIMYTLSHTLIEAEAAIRQPPTYQPRDSSSPVEPDVYGGRPTAIGNNPPAVGARSARSDGPLGQNRLGTAPDPVGDVTQHPTIPVPGWGASGNWSASPSAHSSAAGPGRPSTRHSRPVADIDLQKNSSGALPVGGIIGPTPSASRGPSGRDSVRVNPVGGIIGGQHAVGPVGSNVPLSQPAYGMFGANPKDQQRRTLTHQGSDTTWALPEGVQPVIVPRSTSGTIDPGPAIGLER